MAMGKRGDEQEDLFVTHQQLRSPSHPYYRAVNKVLGDKGFDRYAEGLCAKFYARKLGRPGLAPGVYFRCLLLGYFEGIDSERGIAWRAADSLSLRDFLGIPASEAHAGPLDDLADAPSDRCRDPPRGVHLGSGRAGQRWSGQGQDDWRRRDHAGGECGHAIDRPARRRSQLRGVSDGPGEGVGDRDADARGSGPRRPEAQEEGVEQGLVQSVRPRRQDYEDEGRPHAPGAQAGATRWTWTRARWWP
jgi:hypothetical protein